MTYSHAPTKYTGGEQSLTPAIVRNGPPTTGNKVNPLTGKPFDLPTVWIDSTNMIPWMFVGGTVVWSKLTTNSDVAGPASATDNAIARFDGTTGKIIQNSAVTVADTTGTMTFPAGGGVVLTAGGAATRKGSFTLSSGTTAQIATTSAVTGSVIVYTTVTLGTVTVASSFLTTIQSGVGFTPVASQATDTSVVNWAIVA